MGKSMNGNEISLPIKDLTLQGFLSYLWKTNALVVFAHGSGSSRLSPRNQYVAQVLNEHHLGTLLCDLLSHEEQIREEQGAKLRFDIPLLSSRLTAIVDWVHQQPAMKTARLGLFGASTGAAAALLTAKTRPREISCIVSRGGRPDLAEGAIETVIAPTLLIVGGRDPEVQALNKAAATRMRAVHQMMIIPGATHLFNEPGALEQVANLASAWFERYLIK